jgi:hypothetical protein
MSRCLLALATSPTPLIQLIHVHPTPHSAPHTGALLAELIDRGESGINQDTDPMQFQCRLSGTGSVNTARFSRLRNSSEGANVMG